MKIAWSLLAQGVAKSAADAGLNIRGLVTDGIESPVGFPFGPRRLTLVTRLETQIGEDVEGEHELILLVSDDDGVVITQLVYPFELPANQRIYVVILPLERQTSVVFSHSGEYKFNLILDHGGRD